MLLLHVVQDRTEDNEEHGRQADDQNDLLPGLADKIQDQEHLLEVFEEFDHPDNSDHPEEFAQAEEGFGAPAHMQRLQNVLDVEGYDGYEVKNIDGLPEERADVWPGCRPERQVNREEERYGGLGPPQPVIVRISRVLKVLL